MAGKIKSHIWKRRTTNNINILPEYLNALNKYFKPIKEVTNDYSTKIKEIIVEFKKKALKL